MVETRQLLYVGWATQQQPTSAGTRSDPSRRAGSRLSMCTMCNTRVHVFYTSLMRLLHVSKYQDTRSVSGQPHSPHNSLGQCKHQIHYYHTITHSLCDIFVILSFCYTSITLVTRGIRHGPFWGSGLGPGLDPASSSGPGPLDPTGSTRAVGL